VKFRAIGEIVRVFENFGGLDVLVLQESKQGKFEIIVTGGYTWGGKIRRFGTEKESREYAAKLLKMFPPQIDLVVDGEKQALELAKMSHIGEASYKKADCKWLRVKSINGGFEIIPYWPSLADITTLPEAAENCPLAYSTLAQYAREGKLKARKIGGVWVTTRQEVERYIISKIKKEKAYHLFD
jgi:hypothetical protein